MIDLPAITTNLTQTATGLWRAPQQREVSYPADANEAYFALEDASFWFRHRNEAIALLVRKCSPTATLVDIGGGNGCVAQALQNAGVDVVLVEPGARGAAHAQSRGVRTVVQATLEDAGFAAESLPSAGLFDVLEHIEADAAFLRQIHRLLEPHGKLYLTVPSYQWLWSQEDIYAGHFRRYTAHGLAALLADAGFHITFCSYLFALLVPPIFLARAVPSWIGMRWAGLQATARREHTTGNGVVDWVVRKWLRAECQRLRHEQRIPFGSSCIAVATKVDAARP